MENIQYELSYTVETESDLYSPLKEGTVDVPRAERAFRYWFEELDQEYKARNKFNSRGEIMIFLATVLETIGAVALWNLADTLLVVYPATHMRRRRFRLFAEHFHIVG